MCVCIIKLLFSLISTIFILDGIFVDWMPNRHGNWNRYLLKFYIIFHYFEKNRTLKVCNKICKIHSCNFLTLWTYRTTLSHFILLFCQSLYNPITHCNPPTYQNLYSHDLSRFVISNIFLRYNTLLKSFFKLGSDKFFQL